MSTRAIEGLRFANTCGTPQHVQGIKRPRGAKAHGLRYENSIAKALPEARHGQWFQYVDQNGLGTCQTDLLLEFEQAAFVLESKFTWTPAGHFQVEKLYRPVVSHALRKPTFGFVICKALRAEAEMGDVMVVRSLAEALRWCQKKRTVMHWLGEAPFLKIPPGPPFGAPIPSHTAILVPSKLRA